MIGKLSQNEPLIRKIAEKSSSNTEISKQGSSIPETEKLSQIELSRFGLHNSKIYKGF